MELAKLTSQGQITIPSEIRKYLSLKGGDKVVLIKRNGHVVMANSSMLDLREVQDAFSGIADSMGLKDDDDVVALVKEHRKAKRVQA
jgi:AbrB family looped-hinge helix DNA binding protein